VQPTNSNILYILIFLEIAPPTKIRKSKDSWWNVEGEYKFTLTFYVSSIFVTMYGVCG
jgi:hypothetical protein